MSDAAISPPSWDLRWLRWTLTVLALGTFLNVVAMLNPLSSTTMQVVAWAAFGCNLLFGLALVVYGSHLLLRRLQSSVLDLVVIIAFTGNALGLLLTLPGVRPLALQIVPVIVGWTMLGAVEGLVYARLLRCGSALKRIALLLFAWLQFLGAPLASVAIIMYSLEAAGLERSVGAQILDYRLPFTVAGLAILTVSWLVHRRIKAAARAILGPGLSVPARPVADPHSLQKLQPVAE